MTDAEKAGTLDRQDMGAPVQDDGQPAGLAEPLGQEFEVETPTGRHRGVTVRKPFIDPDKEIPKR